MAEVSRWSEGEKAFPFKKRRGGYDWGEAGGETLEEKKKKMKSKVKRNISDKYKDEDDDDDDYDDKEERAAAKNRVIRRKGRKAGGSLKGGSRCSRVNGRGWQCSRQTLVGYSLCEHHLGKARAKSIGNMIGIRRSAALAALGVPSRNNDGKGDDDDDDLNQPLLAKEATSVQGDQKEEVAWPLLPLIVVTKKKRGKRLGWKRLGNSLLGQAQQHPTM